MALFRRTLAAALTLAIVLLAAPGAGAETVEEVLTRLEPKALAVKSAEMVVEISNNSEMVEMKSETSMWMRREGDHVWSRTETKAVTAIKSMDMKQEIESVAVDTPKARWTQIASGAMRTATKSAPVSQGKPFDSMRATLSDGEATVTGTEEVDGEKCTVVLHKTKGEMGEVATTYWLGEDTGIMRRMVTDVPQMGKTTMRVTAYRPGVEVADSRFEYTPPEGFEVVDTTGGGAP